MAPPFLLLVGLLLAKKAVVASLYLAAKQYGWSRVYRQLMKANKKLMPSQQQKTVRTTIKMAMRLPTQAADLLEKSSDVLEFARLFSASIKGKWPLAATTIDAALQTPAAWSKAGKEFLESKYAQQQAAKPNQPPLK